MPLTARLMPAGGPPDPTWVELDVGAFAGNVRRTREIAGVPLMPVLKADAVGHCAVGLAAVALRHGATSIGVARLAEAVELRQAGIDCELLVLGYVTPEELPAAVDHGVSLALYDRTTASLVSREALRQSRAVVVHAKVNTGLHRLGVEVGEAAGFLRFLRALPGLEVRGIFSHFGSADAADLGHTYGQMRRFAQLLDELEASGLRPPIAHCTNSASTVRIPEARLDMVRVSIALFGIFPLGMEPPDGYRPVLSFHTRVAQVRSVPAGERVGYGMAGLLAQPAQVAVLPVGYADGLRRGPANQGAVLIRGQRCRIVGNVCMDQVMVDVSQLDGVAAGEPVVLIGAQGTDRISTEEVAQATGTIPYEVAAAIGARVPRYLTGAEV